LNLASCWLALFHPFEVLYTDFTEIVYAVVTTFPEVGEPGYKSARKR